MEYFGINLKKKIYDGWKKYKPSIERSNGVKIEGTHMKVLRSTKLVGTVLKYVSLY